MNHVGVATRNVIRSSSYTYRLRIPPFSATLLYQKELPIFAWRCTSSQACAKNETQVEEANKDYFELFGVNPSFTISKKDLKTSYRKLMNELHPDRHSALPSDERDKVTELASTVTSAYSILSNDHSRALYVLEMNDKALEDTASVGQDLLMEVMEIQEEIENETSQDGLKSIKLANDERISSILLEMSTAFEASNFDEAKRLTAILQYWIRIEENIVEKLVES